ncbi:MAG: MoaD/ThiS family protein [Phycisphaerales bacterium]|nr:MoaD/ThiS family protein [Phycisphaerales bacterium]
MRVRVLLFGPEAVAAGAAFIDAEAEEGATVNQIKAAVARACPALAPVLGTIRLAVNAAFVPEDRVIGPADELALIGLVSGG